MLGTNCPSEEIGDLDAVKLSSMSGLFIVTLSISLVAIAAAVFQSLMGDSKEKELDHTATEGEMLRQLLGQVTTSRCCQFLIIGPQVSGLTEKIVEASVRGSIVTQTSRCVGLFCCAFQSIPRALLRI